MRSRRLQSLFRDRSIVLRFLIIVLVVSVLLLISKARLFQTSAKDFGLVPGLMLEDWTRLSV